MNYGNNLRAKKGSASIKRSKFRDVGCIRRVYGRYGVRIGIRKQSINGRFLWSDRSIIKEETNCFFPLLFIYVNSSIYITI